VYAYYGIQAATDLKKYFRPGKRLAAVERKDIKQRCGQLPQIKEGRMVRFRRVVWRAKADASPVVAKR